jgi:hypothetical protein
MRFTPLARAALIATLGAGPVNAASAPGAWQTFVHASEFTALLARSDEVWGATTEAGLYRWDRVAGGFTLVRREPGAIASNRLRALAMDRSGRLWVGTDGDGVSRRSSDGRRWDLVNQLDGLPSDTVQVLEANGDTVWVGTSRGIALWNGKEISGALPDGITQSFDTTFASISVTGVALLGDSLWLSTRRGIGLAHVSSLLADWRPMNAGLGALDVSALATDGSSLLAQVGGDVYRWRADLGRWSLEPGAGVVHRLGAAQGVALAAGESGAFRWHLSAVDSGWTALPGSPAAPNAAATDPEITLAPDGVAFAALADTLYESPAAPGPWLMHPLPAGPPGNDLVQVAVDGARIYMTTRVSGFARYDGTWRVWPPVQCVGAECDTTFYLPVEGLGMFVDGTGRKWVGCWSHALDSFLDTPADPTFTHHEIAATLASGAPDENDPRTRRTWMVCGAQDSLGWRWLGTDTADKDAVDPIGLCVYDTTLTLIATYDQSNSDVSGKLVRGVTVTRNKRVWVGYDPGGVDFVTGPPDSVHFNHLIKTSPISVRGLACYGESLWVATDTGLLRFDQTAALGSSSADSIPFRGGISTIGVKPLAVGPDGAVWLGTGGGLRVFHPGGATDSFSTVNSPIPDDDVRGVAVDPSSGVVWMTTAGGFARFDPAYVTPPPPPLPSLSARVYPNPALLNGLGIQLKITGNAEVYGGAVYDLSGRKLRTIHDVANGAIVWDGRDNDGRLVKPGIYFVRVEAGGRSVVARVALIQ